MYAKSTLLLATFVAFAGGAIAAPVTQFAPRSVARAIDTIRQSDESGFMLVQNRGRGGGGQRAVVAASVPPPEAAAAISTATTFIGTHRTLTGMPTSTGIPTSTPVGT